jgi:hypothetical protein
LHLKYTLSLKDLREGQQFNKNCGVINKDLGSFYVNIARVLLRQNTFLKFFRVFEFFLNYFENPPQVPENRAVTGSDKGKWALKLFQKKPKVFLKSDVTGTRRQKTGRPDAPVSPHNHTSFRPVLIGARQ